MRFLRAITGPIVTMLIGGLLTVWLVRQAPGYGTDPAELDGRWSAESLAALRANHQNHLTVWRLYTGYLKGLARGDLGTSLAWNRPVAQLLGERGWVTLRSSGLAVFLGWASAVVVALTYRFRALPFVSGVSRSSASALLCLPSPAVALLLCIVLRPALPQLIAAVVTGLAIFARVLLPSSAVLSASESEPHVLQARARGVHSIRLVIWHVLRCAAPALLSLLAASVPVAFGIAVPVETVCNLPGAGQLAWLAAEKRDLPVLTGLTFALMAVTLLSTSLAKAWSITGPELAEGRTA
ncbi:MAG TPA: ABC transporter permease [Bryobacteraceae bacterium]|nr:ABC transporter permease [Bryobacteraceae bacterium]